MTLVVETGAGLLNAESYVSAADAATYAINRNLPFSIASLPPAEAALRVATTYIDRTYLYRFPGFRTLRRGQALEWPRAEAFYYTPDNGSRTPYFIDPRAFYPYDLIPMSGAGSIPVEIINATCEAAIRELASPGVLQPDLERGGGVSSYKAGSVEVRYSNAASANTVFQVIEAALTPLLGPDNKLSGRVMRR